MAKAGFASRTDLVRRVSLPSPALPCPARYRAASVRPWRIQGCSPPATRSHPEAPSRFAGTPVMDRSTPCKDVTGPALGEFLRVAKAWRLQEAQELRLSGLEGRSTFHRWKNRSVSAIRGDVLERISHVLTTCEGRHRLRSGSADAWIREANGVPLFGGQAPIAYMAAGDLADRYLVFRHVAVQRL